MPTVMTNISIIVIDDYINKSCNRNHNRNHDIFK